LNWIAVFKSKESETGLRGPRLVKNNWNVGSHCFYIVARVVVFSGIRDKHSWYVTWWYDCKWCRYIKELNSKNVCLDFFCFWLIHLLEMQFLIEWKWEFNFFYSRAAYLPTYLNLSVCSFCLYKCCIYRIMLPRS